MPPVLSKFISGMTDTKGMLGRQLAEFTDPANLEKVVEFGALCYILLTDGTAVNDVIEDLTEIPNVDVYRKDLIPQEFYLKENTLVHDILVVSKGTTFILQDFTHKDKYVPEASQNDEVIRGKKRQKNK